MVAPTTAELTGTPETPASANATPAPETKTPPTPEKTNSFQPVFIGGKKFESPEALANYTSELDRQRVMWESENQFKQKAAAASDPNKELADMIFEDTPAAIRLLTEQAEAQALQKFDARLAQEKAVQAFYEKFNDLKDFSDLVDLTANRLGDKIKQMPQTEAMDYIAKEARSRIAAIKGVPSGGVELPSGEARVASGTGGPATPVQVTTEAENMFDQIRRFQMRGKKQGGN